MVGVGIWWSDPPCQNTLGYVLDPIGNLFGLLHQVYSSSRVRYSAKKFIRWLHVTLRYRVGMDPIQTGSVRKRHIDVLCNAALYIWSVHFCVCLSDAYLRVFYFINIEKQSLSVTRQGRLEMVRGNALRNEYYLAIIFQICNNVICNPAMCTTRALRICNAAKYTDDGMSIT